MRFRTCEGACSCSGVVWSGGVLSKGFRKGDVTSFVDCFGVGVADCVGVGVGGALPD